MTIRAGIVDNAILGADANEIWIALRDGNYHLLSVQKHPLAIVWSAATNMPLRMLGVPADVAAPVTFGLAAALGPCFTFLLLRLWSVGLVGSAGLAALTAAGFSTITVLSVLETYGLTLALLTGALLALQLITRFSRESLAAGIAAGAVAAIAAWANLPLAAVVLIYPWLRIDQAGRASLLRSLIVPAAVGVGGAIAPTVALTFRHGMEYQEETVATWASLSHFFDTPTLIDFSLSAFVSAVVAPPGIIQCRYAIAEAAAVFGDPILLVPLLLFYLLCAAGLLVGLRHRAWRYRSLGLLSVLGTLLLFFLWFAPEAALLFANQWYALFALTAAPVVASSGRVAAFSLVLAAWLGVINQAPLMAGPLTDFDRACPPVKRVHDGGV